MKLLKPIKKYQPEMTKKEYKAVSELLQNRSVNYVRKRICGELLGKGMYRDVFVLKAYPSYVVKIERNMSIGNFANAMEWRNFINNQEWTQLGPWLAPCEFINQTGTILIQERVYSDGKKRKDYPS